MRESHLTKHSGAEHRTGARPAVGRIRRGPRRGGFAGPRVDARVSSPRLAITRLALTEEPDPELEPSEADRVVS